MPESPAQRAMLDVWANHMHALVTLKDPDAALQTMTEEPSIFCVAAAKGATGRDGVRSSYDKALRTVPADLEFFTLFQILNSDRLVEEFGVRFTDHGLFQELVLLAVVQFQNGRIDSAHYLWAHPRFREEPDIREEPDNAPRVPSAPRAAALARISA